MNHSLPIEAAAETVFTYQGAMMVYRGKMAPESFPKRQLFL